MPKEGFRHSEETRKKISDALKGHKKTEQAIQKQRLSLKKFYASGNQSPRKGKKLSDETKRRISQANKGHASWAKGKKFSVEYRKKLSISHKGKPFSEARKRAMRGRKVSEATRRKLRGRKVSEATRRKLRGHVAWNKGKKLSKAGRKKLSLSHNGNKPWNKGKKMSDEAIRNMSRAQKGRKVSEATRRKLRGRKVSEATRRKLSRVMKGRKVSEATRRKLSRAMKGRKPAAITIQRSVEARKGKPLSAEHKNKIKLHNAKYWLNKHVSDATKAKISQTLTGRPSSMSAAQKAKMKKLMTGRKHTWGHKISKSLIGMQGSWITEESKAKIREARLHQVFPVKDTKPEKLIQNMLKVAKIKFQKHIPVRGQPDIFIEPNIAIFVDGDYWHANPKFYKANERIKYPGGYKKPIDKWKKDKMITRYLKKNGYDVLRLWEYDINNYPEKCLQKILKVLK